MICRTCGFESEGALFCIRCGARLEEVPPQPVSTAPVFVQQPTPTDDPGSGKGTASLILGIIALAVGTICSCLIACLGGVAPLACAIVSIVLGKQAINLSSAAGFENKKARTGVILSIVAIVVIAVFILLNSILGGIMASSGIWEEVMDEMYYYY